MAGLRRVLGRIAVTWLLCQAGTLALATTALWLDPTERLECMCHQGDHAACPMHHRPAPGPNPCQITAVGETHLAVFTWLLNIGLMPAPPAIVTPLPHAIAHAVDDADAPLRSAPPEPPPPRA